MANFYNRTDFTNQLTASDLAKLYNAGNLYSPIQDNPSPSYFHGKLNGNKKSSISHQATYPSQLISDSAVDELIYRQQRELLFSQMLPSLGLNNLERELSLKQQLQAQAGLCQSNGGLNLPWCMDVLAGVDGLRTNGQPGRNASSGGSPNASGSAWGSNLDPNSKPFAPRPSHPGSNLEVRPGGDVGREFDLKDDPFLEKDSNANVVYQRSKDKQHDMDKHKQIRQIWEKADNPKQTGLIETARGLQGHSGFKAPFLALDNFPPLVHANDFKQLPTPTSETEEESALKSKHCLLKAGRSRNGSLMSTGDSDEGEDQFGLRSLIKTVQEKPIESSEEADFVEKIRRNFERPAHNYIESPFSNKVVTPMHDSHDGPDEFVRITSTLAGRLAGPCHMYSWQTEMLCFFFYMAPGDIIQIMVGNELHFRGWRYSKSRGVWIARQKNTHPEFRSDTSESGYYQYYDHHTWRREVKYFTLLYEDLADRINVSSEDAKLMDAIEFQMNRLMQTAVNKMNRLSPQNPNITPNY